MILRIWNDDILNLIWISNSTENVNKLSHTLCNQIFRTSAMGYTNVLFILTIKISPQMLISTFTFGIYCYNCVFIILHTYIFLKKTSECCTFFPLNRFLIFWLEHYWNGTCCQDITKWKHIILQTIVLKWKKIIE